MATTAVTAIVDEQLNREATAILARIGMTVDEAIRLLLTQVVEHHDLPFHSFDANAPGAPPYSEIGEGKRFATYDAWFRAEVDEGIREADDPNCVWISQEEMKRRMGVLRAEWATRIPETDFAR
jgi:addiction module RelB/DinJ family antitoxin